MREYRVDIDGLRGIAVLLVILYHAGFDLVSGGFIGVDVFFVISGYLITDIIVREVRDGTFMFRRFYERRFRRLLPALTVVIAVTAIFSWLYLGAEAFKDFAQSVVATTFFSSNILFWSESGYFDTASSSKPLLHTWSLAVEEQFYLLFPLVVFLALRAGKKQLVVVLALIGMASYGLCLWGSTEFPVAAFYLLHTRAWEFVVGALGALLARPLGGRFAPALAGLGLVAVVGSGFLLTSDTAWPGPFTALPVIGALLLILNAPSSRIVGRILRWRGLVWVGLVSYSAYLWHHPMFVFAEIVAGGELSTALSIVLVLLTLGLSYLSWKFVEQPFRSRTRVPSRRALAVGIPAVAVLALAGVLGHLFNGFPKEMEQTVVEPPPVTDQDIYVVGDSHARHLVYGLRSLTTGEVINYSDAGCLPFRDVDRWDSRSAPGECLEVTNASLDSLLSEDPNGIVLLSTMGPTYLDGTVFGDGDVARLRGQQFAWAQDPSVDDPTEIFELGMRQTFEELSTLTNAQVVFLIDIPELGIANGCQVESKEIRTPLFTLGDALVPMTDPASECGVSREAFEERTAEYRALIERVAADYPAIDVVDPTPALCDEMWCAGWLPEWGYLYEDADHLNRNGSALLVGHIFGQLSTSQ